MDTLNLRTQTSFSLPESLLAELRIEAKKHNRSLNKFVEGILTSFISRTPNKQTLAAMKEAEENKNLEILDLDNFQDFVKSL